MQHLKRRPKSMIKVDCSGKNYGLIEIRGDKNLTLNELRYMIRYSVMIMGDVALEAISDGINDGLEELTGGKYDKDNRN